jgi:hypothetical protein
MNDTPADRKMLLWIRLAIVLTALALVLALMLLYKETPYVFTAFMFLGPLLLAAAFVLLGWVILQELKAGRVL